MKECIECYSRYKRITPLLKPQDCLKNHAQYICSTCGRCICIEKTEKGGLQRWNFPFKTLEIAKLYLRTADVTSKTNCSIVEIINAKGRISYKIFRNELELQEYLNKNKDKRGVTMTLTCQRLEYIDFPNSEIRKLSCEEIEKYCQEQQETK